MTALSALLLPGVAIGWLLCAAPQTAPPPKIPALIITGQGNHDWRVTSKSYAKLLEGTGRFDVTITTTPAQTLADAAAISRYRLFVLDYNGYRWGDAAERGFLDAVRAGAGVVVIHSANNAFPGWKEYEQLIGLAWRKGAGHGRFHPFDVQVVDRNHPITAGMPPMKSHPDELYHRLTRDPDAHMRVLMTAFSDPASGGTGNEEPVAAVLEYGHGRVFHTVLGHVWPGSAKTHASIDDPQLRLLIARGAEWAATGACTSTAADFGLAPPPATLEQRAHEPWVFRCVLDHRPRVLVAALDPWMWVAYDTGSCGLFRAWAGDVRLQGAVFTGVHGPQPVSIGAPFVEDEAGEAPWTIVSVAGGGSKAGSDAEPPAAAQYLGHLFSGGHVTLRYRIARTEHRAAVEIEETPEHGAAGEPVLSRGFRVTGLGDDERLELPLGKCAAPPHVSCEGAAERHGDRVRLGNGESRVVITFALREGV